MIDFYNFYKEMSGNTLNPIQYSTLNKLDKYSKPILNHFTRRGGKTSFSSMYLAYQMGVNSYNTHCVLTSNNKLSGLSLEYIDSIISDDKYKEFFPNTSNKPSWEKHIIKNSDNKILLISTNPNSSNLIGMRINGILILDDPIGECSNYIEVEKFKIYFKNNILPIIHNYKTRVLTLTSNPRLTMDYLLK